MPKKIWNKIPGFLSAPAGRYYAVTVVAVWMLVLAFRLTVAGTGGMVWGLVVSAFDALFLTSPFWLFGRRGRWLNWLVLLFVTLFVLVNVWQFRFSGDLMPFSSFLLAGTVGDTVVSTTLHLISPLDVLFLLPFALTFGYWLKHRRQISEFRYPLKIRLSAIACSLLPVMLVFGFTLKDALGQQRHADCLKTAGFVNYTVIKLKNLHTVLQFKRQLTPEENKQVADFFAGKPTYPQDSVFMANRTKNIVMVIVESLNAGDTDMMIDGHPLMPNWQALSRQEGTVYADSVYAQVGDGVSADGHLILLAGVLPVEGMSVSYMFPEAVEYRSVFAPEKMANGFALKADELKVWNSGRFFRSLGFGDVSSIKDIPGQYPDMGQDGRLFNIAADKIARLRQPFAALLVTNSMHTPFTDGTGNMPAWIASLPLNDYQKAQKAAVHYFDTQLGMFVGRLKQMGLLDDTILIVVSDHSLPLNADDDGSDAAAERNLSTRLNDRMAFLAANTGRSCHVGRTVGQIDLYPTMLQIFGEDSSDVYAGVGTPIFDPDLNSAVLRYGRVVGDTASPMVDRQRRAWHISELMLKEP